MYERLVVCLLLPVISCNYEAEAQYGEEISEEQEDKWKFGLNSFEKLSIEPDFPVFHAPNKTVEIVYTLTDPEEKYYEYLPLLNFLESFDILLKLHPKLSKNKLLDLMYRNASVEKVLLYNLKRHTENFREKLKLNKTRKYVSEALKLLLNAFGTHKLDLEKSYEGKNVILRIVLKESDEFPYTTKKYELSVPVSKLVDLEDITMSNFGATLYDDLYLIRPNAVIDISLDLSTRKNSVLFDETERFRSYKKEKRRDSRKIRKLKKKIKKSLKTRKLQKKLIQKLQERKVNKSQIKPFVDYTA